MQSVRLFVLAIIAVLFVFASIETVKNFRGTAGGRRTTAAGWALLFLALLFHEPWHAPVSALQTSLWSSASLALTPVSWIRGFVD